jgi:hypothetical protein
MLKEIPYATKPEGSSLGLHKPITTMLLNQWASTRVDSTQ